MYTLTIHYRGNREFWISKGFTRLAKKNKDALFNYWKSKAISGDKDLLQKIDELWDLYLELKYNNTEKENLEQKPSYPSLFQMAKNVTKSAANFVKGGMKLVSEEQLQKRLEICRSCEKFDATALNGTGRCVLCGCSTALKLKMATEKCPIDKWSSIN